MLSMLFGICRIIRSRLSTIYGPSGGHPVSIRRYTRGEDHVCQDREYPVCSPRPGHGFGRHRPGRQRPGLFERSGARLGGQPFRRRQLTTRNVICKLHGRVCPGRRGWMEGRRSPKGAPLAATGRKRGHLMTGIAKRGMVLILLLGVGLPSAVRPSAAAALRDLPRTECGCQLVAFTIIAMVAPCRASSIAITRACFEPLRPGAELC